MTKPQALPFLVPFAAWFLARGGVRGFLKAAAIGLTVTVIVWLPFIPAGGPLHYLQNLDQYQNDIFAVLSLRAWNLWWIVQTALGDGFLVSDQNRVLGPLTFRTLGYGLTLLLEAVVFLAVLRDPRPRTLILGLAASTLIAFCFLTTMHERYAYGVLIFLMLLLVERPIRFLALAFGIVFTLDLWFAVPPTPEIGAAIQPIDVPLSMIGSVAMIAIALIAVWMTTGAGAEADLPPADEVLRPPSQRVTEGAVAPLPETRASA